MLADVARSLGTDYYLVNDRRTKEKHGDGNKLRSYGNRKLTRLIAGYWKKPKLPFNLIPKRAKLNLAGGTIKAYEGPG